MSASPEQLVVKMYDLAIAACYQGDRTKLRKIIAEMIAHLDMERGGDIAPRLFDIYQYCLETSIAGDLASVLEVLEGLRDAWRQLAYNKAA